MSRKTCPTCDKEFVAIHNGRRGGQGTGCRKYCSYSCQKKFNGRKHYDPAYHRERHLKREYGIDNNDYNQMFNKQNGCCAICGKHQQEFKKHLDVDHCHKTGKVRKLLCSNCNNLLGRSQDNINLLENAVLYLKEHHV